MKVSTMLLVTSYCRVFAAIRGAMWRAIGLDIVHADVICYISYMHYTVFSGIILNTQNIAYIIR